MAIYSPLSPTGLESRLNPHGHFRSVLPSRKGIGLAGGLLLIGVLVVGTLIRNGVSGAVFAATSQDEAQATTLIDPAYHKTVAAQTDAIRTASIAQSLFEKHPVYAALNFKQAATLDANYRDAAYGYALALMKSKEAYSSEDLSEVHKAIDQAERVDPLYIPLLKLKLVVAKMENDTALIEATTQRLSIAENR